MTNEPLNSMPTTPVSNSETSAAPSLPADSQFSSPGMLSQPVSAHFASAMKDDSRSKIKRFAIAGGLAALAAATLSFFALNETPLEEVSSQAQPAETLENAKATSAVETAPVQSKEQSTAAQATITELTFEKSYFEYRKHTLSAAAKELLRQTARQLKSNPEAKVRIAGYADEIGGEKYNFDLSMRRARSTAAFLQKLGVEKHRMTLIAFGEKRPAVKGRSESARKWNRRVEIMEVRKLDALNASR